MKSIFTKKDVIYNRRTSNLLTLPKINTKRFGLYSFGFRSSHLRNQPPDCSFILYNYVLFNVVYKQEKETLLIRIQIENEISYQPFTFSCMVTYQLNQICQILLDSVEKILDGISDIRDGSLVSFFSMLAPPIILKKTPK